MTASNHALTGAVIGLASGIPIIAVPLAVLSHFICDALPHYGATNGDESIGSNRFRNMVIVDALVCLVLVAVLAVTQPQHWLLAAVCAFAATSPDLMWIKKYRQAQKGEATTRPQPALLRFHAAIQWFERPIGIVFEVFWATVALILLKVLII